MDDRCVELRSVRSGRMCLSDLTVVSGCSSEVARLGLSGVSTGVFCDRDGHGVVVSSDDSIITCSG